MRAIGLLSALAAAAGCWAQTTTIPGTPISVNATSSTGSSFVYSGLLTGNATLSLSASGQSCLQTSVYCTNAAGVVVVAGTSGVGQSSSFSGTYGGFNGTWTYGALLMTISGVGTVQVFPVNAADGSGSSTPTTTVSISGASLASLGFGNFSVLNPTITFVLADTLYTDNAGTFSVSGSFTTPSTGIAAPTLSETGTVSLGLLLLAAAAVLLRRPSPVR